ncbi:hypothetical protein PG997_006940 [Apiospora hydei]|uniref:Uncharacterized protein n=1 Tax=Apiospora hydei TaxID=1337664 RepID=A0ABR1WS84_9PEZI
MSVLLPSSGPMLTLHPLATAAPLVAGVVAYLRSLPGSSLTIPLQRPRYVKGLLYKLARPLHIDTDNEDEWGHTAVNFVWNGQSLLESCLLNLDAEDCERLSDREPGSNGWGDAPGRRLGRRLGRRVHFQPGLALADVHGRLRRSRRPHEQRASHYNKDTYSDRDSTYSNPDAKADSTYSNPVRNPIIYQHRGLNAHARRLEGLCLMVGPSFAYIADANNPSKDSDYKNLPVFGDTCDFVEDTKAITNFHYTGRLKCKKWADATCTSGTVGTETPDTESEFCTPNRSIDYTLKWGCVW